MNIELSEETSNLLRSVLAAGGYSSAEELIAALARQAHAPNGNGAFEEMPLHLEVDQVAADQGVGPVADFGLLGAGFWPEGESVDQFLAASRSRTPTDLPREGG